MIWSILLFAPLTWGSSRCEHHLTADQAYARLNREAGTAFDRAVVTLLGQTLGPLMREIAERTRTLSSDDVRRVAEGLRLERVAHDVRPPVEPIARGLGFDASFNGFLNCTGRITHCAPFTTHNRRVMTTLIRAVAVLNHFVWTWRADLAHDPALRGGAEVLRRHSASRDDLIEILWLANDSVLQAAAQLTASPVARISAERLLRLIFAREAEHPSLVNALALALPPGLIGPNGDFYFVRRPLVASGGRLRFSDPFRAFLRRGRERFRERVAEDWEIGRGCPVAHTLDARDPTGLDNYLRAVLHLFDILHESAR